ncbi:ParB N-terminal domain-containing protein [Phaeobacter sp. 22II1-1F12B]|uniref:ParB N-terminal domain-containing protein n=1 Tax=Phaeobacter sp. 22II1-1F12B TaxID=1317111 RepID=UPI000B5210C6|nr:ParB N-terminal domain-containing protein [Phaeobacter sp. 22II1-1F12B]
MNKHIEIAADDTLAPLCKLYLHEINPRQNGSPEDTEAMAASIEINGLIQNLAGFEDPDKPGKIGIVAGCPLDCVMLAAVYNGGIGDPSQGDVRRDGRSGMGWCGIGHTETAAPGRRDPRLCCHG